MGEADESEIFPLVPVKCVAEVQWPLPLQLRAAKIILGAAKFNAAAAAAHEHGQEDPFAGLPRSCTDSSAAEGRLSLNLGDYEGLETLMEAFKGNPRVQQQYSELRVIYTGWRSVRGDGNCYYRAVLYSYIEAALWARPEMLEELHDTVMQYGEDGEIADAALMLTDFLWHVIRRRYDITEPPEVARLIDEVWTTFNSDEYDAAFVRVLRHLVSRFLEQNAQEEVNPDGSHEQNGHITYDVWAQSTAYQNMNNFINDSVLRMGEDAADVTLVACPYVLKVRVCIVMVHRDGDKPQIIEYGPSSFAATTSSSGGDPPLHREQSSALKSDHDHTKGGEASSTTGGSTTQGGSDVGGVVHSPASWPDAEDAAPSPFPSASPSASPPLPIVDCSDTHSGQVDLAPLPPQADSPSQSSRGSPASSSRDAISSPQPCCMMLHVLLRPGHYDVLYTTDRPEDAFVVMPRSERWEREKARPKMQLSVSTSSQNASSDGGEGGLVPWVARGGGGGGGDKTMASGNLRQRVAARWSRLLLTTQGIVESTGGLLSCLEELLRNQLERRRLQNDPCDADVVLGQLMSMIDPLRASLAELDTIPSSIFDDAATPPTTIATTQTRTHPPTALAAQGAALRQRVCSELVQYLQTCAEIPDDEVGTGGAAMAPQSEHQTAECQEVSGGSGEGEGGEANESDEVEVYHTPVSSSRHADRRDGEGEGDGNDGNQPTHHRDTQDRPLTEGSLHPPPAIPCKSISDGAAALMTANDVDDGWGDFGEGQEEDNHDHCAVDTAIEVSLAAIDGNDTAADDAEASEGFVSAASPVPASLPPLDSPVTAASRGTEGSPSPCALSLEPVVWRGGGGGGGDDHDHCGTIVLSPPVEQADLPAAAVAIDDDPGAAGVRVGVGVGLREEPTATATATPDVQETPVLEMHGGNVPMQRRQGEGEAATPMAAGVGDFAQNNSSSSRTQMCCVCLRDGVVDVEGEGEGGRDEREGEGEGGQPLLRLQRLHCGVYIHLDCLREYWRGEVRRHGSVLVDVACPVASCDSVLTAEDLQRAVSHDFRESLKSELEQESAANLELIQQLQNERDDDQRDTPTFQCAICLYEHPVDGSVTLPCPSSHRFCKPCIARHFEEVVMSRRVDKLTCPLPDCLFDLRAQLEQHYSMFQSLLQPKSFQKLLHSLATSRGDVVSCRHPGCEENIIVEPGDDVTNLRCPSGHAFCAKCEHGPHRGETCEQRLSKVHKKDLREHQARVRQLLEEGWKPCPLKCAYGGGFKSEEECDHVTCQCGHEFCWHCGVNRKIPMAHDNRWHKPMCPYFTPRTSVLEPPKYEPACPACQANNGVPCSFPENDGYPHSYVQRGRKSKRPPKHHIHPLPLPHTAAESLDGSPHNQRQHQQQQQQHPHRGGQLFGPAIVMQLPDSQQPPPFAPPMYLPHQQQHQHQQPPHVALPRQESDSNAAMVVQAPSPPPPHPPHGLWVRHPDGSFGPSGDDNAQRQYSYTPQPMTRQNRPCPRNIGMPVPFAASRQLSHFPQPHTPGGGFDMAQPQYQHQQQDPAATAMVVDHHAPGSFVDRAVSENFDFSRGLGRGILHRGQPNTNTNTGPSGLSVPQQQHQQQQLQQQQLQQQPLGRALSAAMAQELPRRAEDVIMQLLGRGEGSGQKGPGGSEGAGGDGAS